MLSLELARLRDTFDGWSRGDPFPNETDWHQFGCDLRELVAKLVAHEIGVELSVIDVLVQSARPGSNVLPVERMRLRGDGGAT
jgi:hypothetical protein